MAQPQLKWCKIDKKPKTKVDEYFENPFSISAVGLIVSFAKVCLQILNSDLKSKYERFGTIAMVQRILVASTLLYDHLHSDGVFVKDSPININLIVDVLEEEAGLKKKRTRSRIDTPPNLGREKMEKAKRHSFQDLQEESRNLLSVLKYSNKHLNTPTTRRSTQILFSNIQ